MRQPASTRKFLTTSEAAALLQVSVATLKRWAQAGLVPSDRTEGGHRRFPRAALEALAVPPPVPGPAAALADQLLNAVGGVELQALALRGHRESRSWAAFGDSLRPAVIELHRRRLAGGLSAVQWLAALERLKLALAHLADVAESPGSRPVVIVAVAAGDRVQHGAPMAQLVAQEAGWRVRLAGAPSPPELATELERERADALFVNASADSDPASLPGLARQLSAVAAASRVPLALSGLGPWPDPAPGATRLRAFSELRAWLDGVRSPTGGKAAVPAVAPEAPDAPLEWTPELAIGDTGIDAQHRRLFATAGGFIDAVREGAGEDELERLLAFVQDYVAVHFRSEEHLMRSRGYPFLDEHAWEHEQFVRRVEAAAAERSAAAPSALAELLGTWLRQHVGGSDRRLGAWLRAEGRARG